MKHRFLTDGCEWILDGFRFKTDAELDAYIQSKIKNGVFTIDSGKLKINKSVDLQQHAVNIIEDIKNEVMGVATLVTPTSHSNNESNASFSNDAEEIESYYKIDKSIGAFIKTIFFKCVAKTIHFKWRIFIYSR